MKKLIAVLFISILVSGCEKDETAPQNPTTAKWPGIYASFDFKNSAGEIVDPLTHLNILYSSNADSVRLSVVIDEYGAAYFHNVLSNQNVGSGVNLLRGKINGNVANLDHYQWISEGLAHHMDSGVITLVDEKTTTLTYTERIQKEIVYEMPSGTPDTLWATRSYAATFKK